MSFSAEVKNELCRIQPAKACCALAELYGMVLYASVLSGQEIRVYTGTPRLSRRILSLSEAVLGETLPWEVSGGEGRSSVALTDREAVKKLCARFDYDVSAQVAWHLNGWHLIEDCCRGAFLRGIFLTGGYAADPEKGYTLEISGTHAALTREVSALLGEMELSPGCVRRRDEHVLYYKDADRIEAFLTRAGAHRAVIRLMEARVIREMRNRINRKVNCETSNQFRTLDTAGDQLDAIAALRAAGELERLDDTLREAARLREEHPEATLAELAALAEPPVSKSGFNHRMRRLTALAAELRPEKKEDR
ncbi:MAG: DNA-binding protein WhiA [Oscillospiraceae bacterium]|nr:DNA-binding protein WhiA [Oscillospiraceae bacterium]